MEIDPLFDAWERAWSGRDPAAFAAVCTEAVHYEDPLTPPLVGVEALVGHARRLWTAAPDVRVSTTGARLSDGTFACAPCLVQGTHTGPLGRVSANKRAVDVHVLVYAEVADGRFLRVRAFFDAYAAAMALGVLPKPGTAGERALLMLRGFGIRG